MKISTLQHPAFWACIALGQLTIVYGASALGFLAPNTNFGWGRLLANPDVGLLQAGLALAILGLTSSRGQSRSWKITAFIIAFGAASVALYHWITYFGGSEFSLLMASALLARIHTQKPSNFN